MTMRIIVSLSINQSNRRTILNAVEFINKCDLKGGLAAIFESGITPQQIELTVDVELRKIIYDAYDAWQKFNAAQDAYYSLVETGKF